MYPVLEDRRISEGIGPTPVVRARQSPNRSSSGELALQNGTPRLTVGLGPSQVSTRAGERVPLAMRRSRGPVPRATVYAAVLATFAGDRPPRYDEKNATRSLQVLKDLRGPLDNRHRGGQAPALR